MLFTSETERLLRILQKQNFYVMKGYKYYDRYDERILVLASLLVAALVLFVLTFFLGCGKDGTHNGPLGSITYSINTDSLKGKVYEHTKVFTDDTTGTTIQIGWKSKCDSNGCVNVSADVLLTDNKKNCIVQALLPNEPQTNAFERSVPGMTDVIITCEMPTLLDKELHVHHYHLFADGTTEKM